MNSEPIPGIRIVSPGPKDWWTQSLELTQDQFSAAELVQIKGGEGYYCKYEVLLTDGRRYVIPNRVSQIAGMKWDISQLQDYFHRQGLNRILGEPVLTGTTNGGEQIEIRGNWDKINRKLYPSKRTKQEDKLAVHQITLDQTNALIQAWEPYSPLELIAASKQAFLDRNQHLQEAAELGTRAHYLIEMWLKYYHLHPLDPITGKPGITQIHYLDRDGKQWAIQLGQEDTRVQNCVMAFWEFWARRELTLIAAETLYADLQNGVAGQTDNLCCTPSGERWIVDYKTGNYISASALLQVSGYAYMHWLNTGQHIDQAHILRLDKKTMTFTEIPVFTNESERTSMILAWLQAVSLFHWQKNAEKVLEKNPQ